MTWVTAGGCRKAVTSTPCSLGAGSCSTSCFPASPNRWCGPAPGSGTTWVVCAGSCRVSDCVRLTSADPRWPPVGHCWRDRSGDESRRPAAATYFRRIAKLIDIPWEIAVSADLAFPGRGWPPQHQGAVGQYLPARLHAAATTDNSLADAFIRVMGMVDRPESLLRPDRALRVLVDTPARRTRADGRASLGQPHL
jgi:hypothetical protein